MDNYECHITVPKPTTKLEVEVYEDLAKSHQWKTSAIEGDPLLGSKTYFYFTTHAKTYDEIFSRMEKLADLLGSKVLRKKIEHVVFDTGKKLLREKKP